MVDFKVNNAPKTIGADERIQGDEWKALFIDPTTKQPKTTLSTVTYGGKQISWKLFKELKGSLIDPATPPDGKAGTPTAIADQTKVVTLNNRLLEKVAQDIKALEADLKKATAGSQKAKDIDAKIKVLKAREKVLKRQQTAALAKFVQFHGAKKLTGKAAWWKSAGRPVPKALQKNSGGGSVSYAGGKAATAQAQPKQAQQTQQQTPTNNAANKGKAAKGGGWGPNSNGWGSQTMNGPKFSSAAYAQSLFMENNISKTWDGINKSQNRGQELMQLLFYYMRMAMSGDLTAMYNMMKAVLYIISKDKALQQVDMAKKLITLQDESRRATDKLLNFNADQKDPNSQMQFTKMLQQVKSESDSIATSQKLVSQMMEEMAQIVETLTNVTKGALDAAGRVLRTVSRFN